MQEIEMKVLPLDHPDKGMDFNYSIRTGWLSDGKFLSGWPVRSFICFPNAS
jgi:hypothetical protein